MTMHVIELPATGGRGVVDGASLADWLSRGFVDVGVTTDRGREPVISDAEWAELQSPSVARRKKPTNSEKE